MSKRDRSTATIDRLVATCATHEAAIAALTTAHTVFRDTLRAHVAALKQDALEFRKEAQTRKGRAQDQLSGRAVGYVDAAALLEHIIDG